MNKKKTTDKKPDAAQAARTAAATLEWEKEERRRIRALLKLPMLKRSNFLRVRIGNGSAL